MANIIYLLKLLVGSIWNMMIDSAFLLLIGFILAGIIHLLLNEKNIVKILKGSPKNNIIKTALIGVPLPLCSCSVLPVAGQLNRSGISKGSTTAFLISTPETGIDSILLTYSMTDPILTVARPVTAFLTAITAGFLVEHADKTPNDLVEKVTCSNSCGCVDREEDISKKTIPVKIFSAIKYAFTDLLADLAPYLFIGYLLAGVITVILGDNLNAIPDFMKTGWGSYLGAIIVGLPLYICATSSTPLAAALLKTGFSPGAILVFLLVGPATNIASLTVITKILKTKALLIYLASIIFVSVMMGILTDYIYVLFNINYAYVSLSAHESYSLLNNFFAMVLSFFIIYYTAKKIIKRFL